jgi:hypothetical protein
LLYLKQKDTNTLSPRLSLSLSLSLSFSLSLSLLLCLSLSLSLALKCIKPCKAIAPLPKKKEFVIASASFKPNGGPQHQLNHMLDVGRGDCAKVHYWMTMDATWILLVEKQRGIVLIVVPAGVLPRLVLIYTPLFRRLGPRYSFPLIDEGSTPNRSE